MEMASNGTSYVKVQRKGFAAILKSAACEWFLIFLLLIDAVFSYLATKFARYCDLQIPCVLCSRIDHSWGKEKPDFYRKLFCSDHTSEISTLLSCQVHSKLADGRGMCDNCLLSFSTNNKPNPDMHRLFLGKIGVDICGCGPHGLQRQFLNRDLTPASVGTRLCSCCNKPWRSRQNVQRLLQLRLSGNAVNKPNIPLPRRLSRRDSLKKMRDKFSASSHYAGKSEGDPMSHVGYTELKITSDSESEFPLSDDDDVKSVVPGPDQSTTIHTSGIPFKRTFDDVLPTKMIDDCANAGSLPMDSCPQTCVTETRDVRCLTPDVVIGHNLDEHNLQQSDEKTCTSLLSELISLDDIPLPSSPVEIPVGGSSLSQESNPTVIPELISLVDVCPSFDVMEVPVIKSSNNSDVTGVSNVENVSNDKDEEILKLATTTGARIINGLAPVHLPYGAQTNINGSVVSINERKLYDDVAEHPSVNENGANDALKLMLSQNFSTQGIDLLLNNLTPHVPDHAGDQLQIVDAFISNRSLDMHQSDLMEQTYDSADLTSFDGSNLSDMEGESLVERLKQQVEYDRRCLNALYKELEEERNAAAIAVNQAMAMITRLQEEKAALHMEALQYLRMMEEQAEYDVDALEKANDLLAEKEKEIQDLEAELEICKLKLPDELLGETVPAKANPKAPFDFTGSSTIEGMYEPSFIRSSWPDIENEKLYIAKCLKCLERKLYQCADNGTLTDAFDAEGSEEEIERKIHFPNGDGIEINGQMKENGILIQKDLTMPDPGLLVKEGSTFSNGKNQVVGEEKNLCIPNEHKDSTYRDKKLVALENEISDLNERLEALEADCNFLERSFNYLENGEEGLIFIRHIAFQLQELRKLGIMRKLPVP